MGEANSAPMYNLKAVVKETGLKPDTLRAWERRYGLPEPRRTPSGHRLYSDRDIAILKWLLERQEEGLSISRAVALWHQLINEGKDPISVENNAQSVSIGTTLPATAMSVESVGSANVDMIDQLRQRWIFACLAFDEQQAEQILEEAFSIISTEKVCLSLLQQGLAEIGLGWLQGTITPQQEHFASSLAMRRLQSLLSSTPAPTKPERILVGCPPEETHTFSPTLVALLLRRRGWNVIYLGANVPLENIQDTVVNTDPNLIILSAQQLHTAATLVEIAIALIDSGVPIAFGGRIFTRNETLQQRIPGHYLGNQVEQAVHSVEKILKMSQEDQLYIYSKDRLDLEAASAFEDHRSQIESDVWQNLETIKIDRRFLTAANSSLGRTIRAILILQLDAEQMHDIDSHWLRNMLPSRYPVSSTAISLYLATYANTVQQYLGDDARTVTEWLRNLESMEAPLYQTA